MRFFSFILIVLGLSLSVYLLQRHFSLAEISNDADLCSIVFGSSCDETLRSPFSMLLGIPLAGWGIVYFGTIASILLIGWSLGESFHLEANLAALLCAMVAALGSVILATLMLSGTAPFCPLCAIIQAVCVTLVPLLKWRCGRSFGQLLVTMKTGIASVIRRDQDVERADWKRVVLLTFCLVSVVLYQSILILVKSDQSSDLRPFRPSEVIADFQSAPQREIAINEDDPQRGPHDAAAVLVIFSDFQCPACRRFANQMSSFTRRFPGELRVVFKHFPLGSACNRAVKRNLHPRACELAWAAEAAQKQDLFWEYHDAVFAAEMEQQTTVGLVQRELDPDMVRFNQDRMSDDVKESVENDVKEGIRLGIDGTPSFFLNGRRLYDTRLQALEFLVLHVIENSKTEPPKPNKDSGARD